MGRLFLCLLVFVGGCSNTPVQISDAQIVAYSLNPETGNSRVSGCDISDEVIGINRGMRVIASHRNDHCYDGPERPVRYDRPSGPQCERAGGISISFRFRSYCAPALLTRKQRAGMDAWHLCSDGAVLDDHFNVKYRLSDVVSGHFVRPAGIALPKQGESCESFSRRAFAATV